MTALADLDPAALAQFFAEWGYKPSHAARVLRAFYEGRALESSPSRGLPPGLVDRVQKAISACASTLAARQVAADGTTKLLLRLADGRTVESVLMPD
ncbi:MAG: 23S rRNA (adenine(2503)-C(2))-methyltransferase RlmN, partial [Verrucomicrobia bacterium]|nr:23S rRNA (adenine(2503)-C(2))-methyltransferase RlmN [Verrucomicrobiota bacterium]